MPANKTCFVPGRKGRTSVADALIAALQAKHSSASIGMSLDELRTACSKALEFEVSGSTIRSVIYKQTAIFERSGRRGRHVYYRLTSRFAKAGK
jgi:hypothetical protein